MNKRSYSKPKNQKDKSDFVCCPVLGCNRKYKKEEKLIQHVENVHYHSTIMRNWKTFSNYEKSKIYELAADYIQILYDIQDYESEDVLKEIDGSTFNTRGKFIKSSTKLLPQNSPQSISRDELIRICDAHCRFAKRIIGSGFFSDLDNVEKVVGDLQLFFNLGLPYYDTNFCPTLFIDFYWHVIMQDSDFYLEVCEKFIGKIIPHCVSRDEEENIKRHEYFCDLFEYHFHQLPITIHLNTKGITGNDITLIHLTGLSDKYLTFHNQEIEAERIKKEKDALRRQEYEEEKRKETELYNKVRDWLKENNYPIESQSVPWNYVIPYQKGFNLEQTTKYLEEKEEEYKRLHRNYVASSC